MIKILSLSDETTVNRIIVIQQLAYRIEADLIGFDGIPALHETASHLAKSEETFLGYFVDDVLAAALSYKIEQRILDIGRLVVHPDYFRRGIARALVNHVDTITGVDAIQVSTGKDNLPARRLYEKNGYVLYKTIELPEGLLIVCYKKSPKI